jgi:hypothetical protein
VDVDVMRRSGIVVFACRKQVSLQLELVGGMIEQLDVFMLPRLGRTSTKLFREVAQLCFPPGG